MANQSYLELTKDGKISAYIGPDATIIPGMYALAMSLRLWAKTKIIPTRGYTITKMMERAAQYLEQPKMGPKKAAFAAEMLVAKADAMKAKLPTVTK